jgi:hypothetical protein
VLAGAGLLTAALRRDRRALLFLYWGISASLSLLLLTRSLDPSRYSIGWMPAFIGLAASVTAAGTWPRTRVAAAAVAGVVVVQALAAQALPIRRTRGYEEAAAYVMQHFRGGTILYNGLVDTGLFPFFVRKHDPGRRAIVLRGNKLFTTSLIDRLSIEDRISAPGEIRQIMDRYGTVYLVLEEVDTGSPVLNWVADVVAAGGFVERFSVPLEETDERAAGVTLRVFEYVDAKPPDPDAVLDLRLPAVGKTLDVRLGDLLARKYLR